MSKYDQDDNTSAHFTRIIDALNGGATHIQINWEPAYSADEYLPQMQDAFYGNSTLKFLQVYFDEITQQNIELLCMLISGSSMSGLSLQIQGSIDSQFNKQLSGFIEEVSQISQFHAQKNVSTATSTPSVSELITTLGVTNTGVKAVLDDDSGSAEHLAEP